jgi:hypothetical protein
MSDTTTLHSGAANPAFSDIEDIIADIREGKMVIMVDDENRENEGDLLMAAAKVQSEDINYMATHGRGLICLTISRERCKQLRLPLMVKETDQHHSTNFTLSIEAAEGITTGISAHDRARTVQILPGWQALSPPQSLSRFSKRTAAWRVGPTSRNSRVSMTSRSARLPISFATGWKTNATLSASPSRKSKPNMASSHFAASRTTSIVRCM